MTLEDVIKKTPSGNLVRDYRFNIVDKAVYY